MEKKVEQKNAKQKEKFKKPRPLSFTASLSSLIRTRHFSLWKSKLFFVCWQFLVSHPRPLFRNLNWFNVWFIKLKESESLHWFSSRSRILITLLIYIKAFQIWSAPVVSSVTPQVIRVETHPIFSLVTRIPASALIG